MNYTVYQITNLLDGKIYIGKHQTNNLDDGYMGSGKMLVRAIKKHGLENFKKEILFRFAAEEEMNQKEAELVTEEFVKRTDTYNLCVGGKGGFGYINNDPAIRRTDGMLGKTHSPKTRARLAITSKGNQHGSGFPSTALYGMLGKKHKEETKEKMRAKAAGKNNSQYGVKKTADQKIKASETMKTKPLLSCSVCGFECRNLGLLNRWHNDNCRGDA